MIVGGKFVPPGSGFAMGVFCNQNTKMKPIFQLNKNGIGLKDMAAVSYVVMMPMATIACCTFA